MIKKIGAIIGISLSLAAFQNTFAQERQGTLSTLWEEVKATYPGIDRHEALVRSTQMETRAITGERLPQLKTQAQNTYGTYNGIMGGFFPQPGLFNVSGQSDLEGASWTPNSYASATLEWEFLSFGKMRNKSKAAQAKTNKAMSEQEAYLLQLQKDLAERYIRLLYNESKLESNQQNVDRLETIQRITGALAKAGLKTEADSLLSTSSYNQALGVNEKLKGQKQAAIIKLHELTGKDLSDFSQSVSQFLDPAGLPIEKSTESIEQHPLLTSIDAQRESLEYSGKSQSSAALPSVNLLGGYAYRGVGVNSDGIVSDRWEDGFSNSVINALVGVGITWNISDLYTQKQRGSSLKAQAESQQYLYEQFEKQMHADLAAIQQQIQSQYAEVQKTLEAQEQAKSAYTMYLARYQSGLMDLSALLQIQMLLEQAEKTHIEAAYDYWLLLAAEAELLADFDYVFTNL